MTTYKTSNRSERSASQSRVVHTADDVLTDADQQALYCFVAIKGGEYRRDEMRRRGVTEEHVNSLVLRGYLKRNKAGATQVTTKGKNARDSRIR